MMLRRATFALLLFAIPAQAGPVSWAKAQLREHPVRTRIVATAIAAGVYARGLQVCRAQNVENCQAHYGAAWASYGATMALDAVAQGVGYKIGGKLGDAISYGANAAVLGWGAWQWHGGLNKPKEHDEASKPDLRSLVLVRR